jgi:hypothetical protein
MFSFGLFSGVCILNSNVLEHFVCSIFIGESVRSVAAVEKFVVREKVRTIRRAPRSAFMITIGKTHLLNLNFMSSLCVKVFCTHYCRNTCVSRLPGAGNRDNVIGVEARLPGAGNRDSVIGVEARLRAGGSGVKSWQDQESFSSSSHQVKLWIAPGFLYNGRKAMAV